jgi:hypothetical protein
MPWPSAVKDVVAEKPDAFLSRRVPPHVVEKIRFSYTFRGNTVTIWENRAPWTKAMTEWTSSAVAQLRYDSKAETGMLYRRDRNSRWHNDEGLAPVKNIDRILAQFDRDPTGIYWG